MERTRLAIFLFSISLLSVSKAKDGTANTAVYIVIVEKPEGIQLEAFYLKTLSAVLGSMEAAKKALIYSYEFTTYGFAAYLTREQAFEISKQPGVLSVMISKKYKVLPTPPGPLHVKEKQTGSDQWFDNKEISHVAVEKSVSYWDSTKAIVIAMAYA